MAYGLIVFAAFICCVSLTAYLLPRKIRYVWLLVCSWAFFVWLLAGMPTITFLTGGPSINWQGVLPALGLLLGHTAASYVVVLCMGRCRAAVPRALLLCLGLTLSLGLWAACKFLGLLPSAAPAGFALPLGVGFYTFQAAGYAVDVYKKRCPPERNPLRYALFAGFFACAVTGPLNRGPGLLPQLENPAPFSYRRVFGGLFRMLWGAFKKLVIANSLALFTGHVMASPTVNTGPVLVLCLVAFALQLYCDLSAFADLAVGTAGMLGFETDEGFLRPFGATSMGQLWQRWMAGHVSLLEELAALPLGALRRLVPALRGGAGNAVLTAAGTLLAFTAFGLWHGAKAGYLLWGLITGAVVAASRLLAPLWARAACRVPLYRARAVRGVLRRVWVFVLFCAVLLFFMSAWFSAPLSGWSWRLFAGWGTLSPDFLADQLARAGLAARQLQVLGGALLLVFAVEGFSAVPGNTVANWVRRRWFFIRWPLYALLILGIVFFGAFTGAPGMLQAF